MLEILAQGRITELIIVVSASIIMAVVFALDFTYSTIDIILYEQPPLYVKYGLIVDFAISLICFYSGWQFTGSRYYGIIIASAFLLLIFILKRISLNKKFKQLRWRNTVAHIRFFIKNIKPNDADYRSFVVLMHRNDPNEYVRLIATYFSILADRKLNDEEIVILNSFYHQAGGKTIPSSFDFLQQVKSNSALAQLKADMTTSINGSNDTIREILNLAGEEEI